MIFLKLTLKDLLGETHGEVKNDVKVYTGKIAGLKRKKTEQEKKLLKCFKWEKIC